MSDVREVIILGSGPSGLTAAIYAARANLRPLVIEGLEAGGQLMMTTAVENFPGFREGILGPELMGDMRAQAERFGAEVSQGTVTAVDFGQRPFEVRTGGGDLCRPVGDCRDGGLGAPAGPSRRAEAHGPRRVDVCHLRRLLLPEPSDCRGRGRGLRAGGGDVPDEVRLAGDPGAPARRAPRLEGHAGQVPGEPEDPTSGGTASSTTSTTSRKAR